MAAATKELIFAIAKGGYEDTIRRLLESGFDVNTRNDKGNTLLLEADFKRPSLIKLLIENGANVNLFDEEGVSPLHLAVKSGNVESAQLLLSAGSDVNSKFWGYDNDAKSVFYFAIVYEHEEMVSLLLANGVDVNCSTDWGYTVLHGLDWLKNENIIETILQRSEDVDVDSSVIGETPLYSAAAKGNLILFRKLIEHGANVNSRVVDDETPLYWAAQRLRSENDDDQLILIKILLDKGADPNAKHNRNSTPLLLAAMNLSLSPIKLLLERGAKISTVDYDGGTILHYAASNRRVNVMNFILDRADIDLNARTVDGKTALHIAAEFNNLPTCILLLNRGCDIHAKSTDEMTPLRNDNVDLKIKKLLLKYMAIQYSIGVAINKIDNDVITKDRVLHEYFHLCIEELEKMKATKVYYNLSFHLILMGSRKILSGFAKNYELTGVVTDNRVPGMFPIFYKIMWIKFHIEIIKQKMIQKATECLDDIFNVSPFNIISREVVKYLNNEDLVMLTRIMLPLNYATMNLLYYSDNYEMEIESIRTCNKFSLIN